MRAVLPPQSAPSESSYALQSSGCELRSPHVIAAKKMKEKEIPIGEGNLIEYFIAETREKKKLVRDKVKLPFEKGEYNIEYYLERQILPAIEKIFQVLGINIKEITEGKKQMTLEEF